MKKIASILFSVLLLVGCTASTQENDPKDLGNKVIRISTTTSVNDSGLLGYLQPLFEEETGYRLEITSNGTGAAIKLGEKGDADLLLVHAKESEEKFVESGYGKERIPFMYNFFVIVGPQEDEADVKHASTAVEAFQSIANSSSTFVSRGDESGTHKAEMKIWKAGGIEPVGQSWYMSSGQGMGATLSMSDETRGYALTDKGTFLSYQRDLDLSILKEEDESLKNTYSLIVVDEGVAEGINSEGAQAFIDWIQKETTLQKIADYGKEEYGESLFYILEK